MYAVKSTLFLIPLQHLAQFARSVNQHFWFGIDANIFDGKDPAGQAAFQMNLELAVGAIENNKYFARQKIGEGNGKLGGDSEREFSENIVKVKAKSSKIVSEIKEDFAKMQKLKAESLKKVEEMLASAEKDLEKLEQKIAINANLVSESKRRLNSEIIAARTQIKEKYDELKRRIVASIVPE